MTFYTRHKLTTNLYGCLVVARHDDVFVKAFGLKAHHGADDEDVTEDYDAERDSADETEGQPRSNVRLEVLVVQSWSTAVGHQHR